MAKENRDTTPNQPTKEPTPWEKFDRLAKKIARVPKEKIAPPSKDRSKTQ